MRGPFHPGKSSQPGSSAYGFRRARVPGGLAKVASVLVVTMLALGAIPAGADTSSGQCGPEGFSEAATGLPVYAVDAWNATVLIESIEVVRRPPGPATQRTHRGAGMVLRLHGDAGDDDRRTAHVVTNAHVLPIGELGHDIRLGFSRSGFPDDHLWTDAAKVVSINESRDLAILEVEIPNGAAVAEPRLAAPACVDPGDPRVVSVGWPDLSQRKEWGVSPPPNILDHIKRYSQGSFRHALESYRLVTEAKRLMDRVAVVFHDADVLPGSSGGPVINSQGEVVGINTHVVGGSRSPHNRYCARAGAHGPDEGCIHLAIAATEIVAEYARVLSIEIAAKDCSSPAATTAQQKVAALDSPRQE